MKVLLAGFVAASLLLGSTTVYAQDGITADPAETRIVIAPPLNPVASALKSGLSETYAAARPDTGSYRDAQKLYFFYGARHFEPLWLTEGTNGKLAFSDNALKIRTLFEDAGRSGLNPADYLRPDIDIAATGDDATGVAQLESAFSAAVLRYAQHLHGGRINPRNVSGYITLKPNRIDEAETLIALANATDPARIFSALEPTHREYLALRTALGRFEDGTVEEPIVIPDGKTLRPGNRDPRVPLIRKRLGIIPPTPVADGTAADANADTTIKDTTYDDALVAAIEAFQDELGLVVDGIAGPATVAALNGGSATSKADIIANMERWRWMPRDLGDFHVLVNIPEFRLAIVRNNEPVHTTRVVVGKPANQTPVFSDEIEHIVVNPYWNVPSSIASNEIGPQLVTNPGYIARNNMQLLYGGKVVDAAAVDWSTTSVNNFRIRQLPGRSNALGSVKFLFPNQHDVYLHDTPSKSLFQRSYRAFSHGCVRVLNPWDFAAALVQGDADVKFANLEGQRGSKERWNNLAQHIPVHIAYFTLRVDEDGKIRSFGDVYGHNAKLKRLLGE